MRRRSLAVAVLLAPLVAGVVVLRTFASTDRNTNVAFAPLALPIDAPSEIKAGEAFRVRVRTTLDAPVVLDVLSALASERLDMRRSKSNDGYEVTVPSRLASKAGVLGLLVTTSDSIRAMGSTHVRVRPGLVANDLVPLAAPRAMVADGRHWTMVSVIPTDRYGNGLEDGTPVSLHVRRPDGNEERLDGTVRSLIAGLRVDSGLVAGDTRIRLDVGGVSGAEVDVAEVPGPPASFSLNGPPSVIADGRTLITISTSVIRDDQGNQALDGTSVSLQGTSPSGVFRSMSQTTNGVATFRVEAPKLLGPITMTAFIGAVPSRPLTLMAESNDVRFNVSLLPVKDAQSERVEVRVGPVLSKFGGFVDDGTPVTISFPDGTEFVGQVVKGIASFDIARGKQKKLRVETLGSRREVTLP